MDYSFGSWIKRRRKALDMTRQELAHRVGCSLSAIYKIEADERRPSRQIAELLAEHLEIPAEQRLLFLKVARRERMVETLEPLPVPIQPVPPSPSNPSKTNLPAPPTPLVGRAEEHNRLVAAYRQVCRGQAQTVCILGEAGMGKTRLASEFLDWAERDTQPADVLRGRAFEIGGRLPYQPVVDALRVRLDQEKAPASLLSEVWLAELSQLLPELRERHPDLPAPIAGDADFVRARLFEAVASLGIALAERWPLVMFVDDVQWADADTRDLLRYLVHRWTAAGTRAMLLVTVRQEAVLVMPALRAWLTSLGQEGLLTRLELAPLTRSDLRQLVCAIDAAGGETGDAQIELGDWLLTETGGSPFFVAEMLQMLQEQQVLVSGSRALSETGGQLAIDAAATLQRIHSAGHMPIPPNVREVILTRLARLSDKASTLLLAGAVIGRQASFERLCQVARLDEFDGLPALEELLNSRLMLETGDESKPFTFAHDNIRDVAYTEAGVTRRRLYHRQAFSVLEQDGAPPAELAFHAAAARLPEPAFRYALAAGDAAMALHAYADAVTHYSSALELADQVQITSAQRCHLCTHYGRALELCGRYTAALAHYEAMSSLAQKLGDRALALAALVAQGTIRTTPNELSDYTLAETLGQQALAIAHELEDRAAEAKIQWNLLNAYRHTRRSEQALAAGERALALAQELGLREQMAYAANDLVYVYSVAGDLEQTLSMLQTATGLWRELGNQPMLTDSLTSHATTLAWMGDYENALAIAEEGLQIGRSLDNQWSQSNSLISFALVYWPLMAVDQALAVIEESIRLAQATGFVGARVVMNCIQVRLRLALGDVQRAREQAEEALEGAIRNIPLVYSEAAGSVALVALHEGNQAQAGEILASIPEEAAMDIFNLLTLETATCQYHLRRGDYEQALTLSCKVVAFSRERKLHMYLPDFLYFQGQALAGLGQVDRAREALEEAVMELQETGSRWHLWEISALLAGLAEERGDLEQASRWQALARDTIRFIADQISDPSLRAGFLEQPQVRILYETTNHSDHLGRR